MFDSARLGESAEIASLTPFVQIEFNSTLAFVAQIRNSLRNPHNSVEFPRPCLGVYSGMARANPR